MIQLGKSTIERFSDAVYIVAEIGQNHQGDIKIAKSMILKAKEAGCDCVKFQKSFLPSKFTQAALLRRYDGEHSWGNTYGEHKTYLELSLNQYQELQTFCAEIGIDFTASAMDEVSLDLLDKLNVPFIKIGSGDANNFLLLEKASKLKRPLVISTGMQSMKTIERISEIMKEAKKFNYALLHCISAYPTRPVDCNLMMIPTLQHKFPNVVLGYSGHEEGIEISKAAVLLGARIIERHFTLDKTQKGSDHKCSLEPDELQLLVRDIACLRYTAQLKTIARDCNEVLSILGESDCVRMAMKEIKEKEVLPCELSCKNKLGKSIVASKQLMRGQKLQQEDICIKVSEPNGLSAELYYEVLGTILVADVEEDTPISYFHIRDTASLSTKNC